ncbi:glycosyltransferase [Plantactinospora sp. B5E13]|uniref:glycosyltransferase n=1 Tax=unclassified Plantactinospora TaxID=2631981 RepID=UPI00325EAECE
MRWLVFGSYDVRRHPRVGVLVQGLRAAGDQVDEVNVPLALDTAARVAVLRQPWRLPLLVGKLARCWWLLAWRARPYRRRARPYRRWGRGGSTDGVDAVLVGYLGHFDVHLARWLFRRTPIVLDHLVSAAGTAADRGLAARGGVRDRLMRLIDVASLGRADLVVLDTVEQVAGLPEHNRDRAVVVPVGAGADWFAAGAGADQVGSGDGADRVAAGTGADRGGSGHGADRGRSGQGAGRLRVVFVGLFTPLHGTVTVGAALARLAADERIEVSMVGTGQDHPACRRAAAGNPRITWYDWIPAAELPAFVAGHHVSLGIFGTTAKALRVVPTKVFQGAAAGCAVVTSDTGPQRRALGDAALLVPPGDPEALAAVLRELADDPLRVAWLRRAARRRAVDRFAPATVVAPLRHRLAAGTRHPMPEPARPVPVTGDPDPVRGAGAHSTLPEGAAGVGLTGAVEGSRSDG